MPVRYLPDAMVWSLVEGYIVCAACIVTGALKLTAEVPAVPEEIYPADTTGVTDTFLDKVNVLEDVESVADVAVIVEGGVALPEAIVFVALFS